MQDGWMCLERTWQDGDCIELNLPQQIWVSRLDEQNGRPCAVMHGPVALAAQCEPVRTLTEAQKCLDGISVQEALAPERSLHYSVKGGNGLLFRPFYEYREYEPYFLYFDCMIKD